MEVTLACRMSILDAGEVGVICKGSRRRGMSWLGPAPDDSCNVALTSPIV
jgi:hypothetical protein